MWPKMGEKIVCFFKLLKNFGHYFFLHCVDNWILYCLPDFCINSTPGKNLVPEISAEMFSANQVAEFQNWLSLEGNDRIT